MEIWEKNKIKEITEKTKTKLEKKKDLSEKLKEITNNDEKLKVLEDLNKIYDSLIVLYKHLELFSKVDHNFDINNALKEQIEYFDQALDILKSKYKIGDIHYSFFLKLARLQYEFFDRNREEILNKYKSYEGISIGEARAPEVNIILNTIHLAMHNVQEVIQEKRQTRDFDTLYIYFEIYGDLFINIYALEEEAGEIVAFPRRYNIDNAFECYEEASDYKSKIELPSVSRGGLVGVEYIRPFFNFFKDMSGDIYNVDHKLNYVYEKFATYLERKTKSYCWKTGEYCEYKKDKLYTLQEGNGVFISMNYSNKNNFSLLSYIRKVLYHFRLNPILKQDRIKSPSWTKEICCTIYNNKYSIIFLDKYSPNVVLELGVCFGMGRKVIILVNEISGSIEQSLFSMIRDYDCIIYKNAKELFEKLIHSINGLFFNNVDYKIPDILQLFSEDEINKLNNLIKNYSS